MATPLGNLQDVSSRMVATLRASDVIAAEDTRVARRLLSACGITGKKVVSLRQHNERAAAAQLARAHPAGQISYVSDAGTPGVSDPGAVLVSCLRERGFAIIPIPGPCAVAAALSAAGFGSGGGHVFCGFLPRTASKAAQRLTDSAGLGLPIVIYESPRRVAGTVAAIVRTLGEQTPLCVCRELTKLHEQIVAGTAAAIGAMLANERIPARGEFTLVAMPAAGSSPQQAQGLTIARTLLKDLPAAKAARLAARIAGADARELYQQLREPDGKR